MEPEPGLLLWSHLPAVESKAPARWGSMSSADEFRKYVDECLAWAKQAVTDYEREIHLTMAQDWLHAATLAEQPSIPSPSISLGS